MKTFFLLCCTVLAVVIGSVDAAEPKAPRAPGAPKKTKTIFDELGFKGFNTFKQAITTVGMADKFNGAEEFTFLAPTDVAFRDMPKVELDALFANKEKLKTLLERHIVAGRVSSADLNTAKTLAGTSLDVKTVDGKTKIGNANLTKPDIAGPNGMIQGIDKLLAQ